MSTAKADRARRHLMNVSFELGRADRIYREGLRL